MNLPQGAVVAVADGEKLQLFQNTSQDDHPALMALPAEPVGSDNHGSGGRHQSSSANPDHGQVEEDAHAAGVAALLNSAVTAHTIKNLVIIAAPKTLGELRKHYSKQLEAALKGEINKDLTGHNIKDIEKAIQAA